MGQYRRRYRAMIAEPGRRGMDFLEHALNTLS
jgi:hypothetical protein